MAAGQSLLVEVGQPAALVARGAVGVLVQLQHARDRPLEERPVVADHDHAGLEVVDEALEAFESVEVEVVGRLVEEVDVEPAEEHGRQLEAGRLAARERGGRLVEHAVGQAELGQQLAGARLEVGATERQPPVESDGVAVVGSRGRGRERVGGALQLGARRGHAGAAGQEVAGALVGPTLGLLGQVADGRCRRGELRRGRGPGPAGRPGPAAASSCPPRWDRPRRSGDRARRSGRRRRGSSTRRG